VHKASACPSSSNFAVSLPICVRLLRLHPHHLHRIAPGLCLDPCLGLALHDQPRSGSLALVVTGRAREFVLLSLLEACVATDASALRRGHGLGVISPLIRHGEFVTCLLLTRVHLFQPRSISCSGPSFSLATLYRPSHTCTLSPTPLYCSTTPGLSAPTSSCVRHFYASFAAVACAQTWQSLIIPNSNSTKHCVVPVGRARPCPSLHGHMAVITSPAIDNISSDGKACAFAPADTMALDDADANG